MYIKILKINMSLTTNIQEGGQFSADLESIKETAQNNFGVRSNSVHQYSSPSSDSSGNLFRWNSRNWSSYRCTTFLNAKRQDYSLHSWLSTFFAPILSSILFKHSVYFYIFL